MFHPQQVIDDSGVSWSRFFLFFRCFVDEFSSPFYIKSYDSNEKQKNMKTETGSGL